MTDPVDRNSAEDLDEDRLRLDPLEEGMDPPEHWSPAMDGTTPREEREGQDLDARLGEEQPDNTQPPPPVDEVDRMAVDGELDGHPPDGQAPLGRALDIEQDRQGQTADGDDQSVARELRTPRD